ncbi:MAG: linear amide C-N hydrolase [Phycisphaerales bacterium]|nr:MAG: linear amide C-N hydrolase [Phycisphaerales bacterium]
MTTTRTEESCVVRVLFVVGCVTLLLAETSIACTCFCLRDGERLVFGRNYDWHLDDGLIVVNKRGVAKRALLLDFLDRPAQWIAKYGSVTFNQYGREMPNGGINEAGLVLEVMMLPGTQYPGRDKRPAVMAWVQYQLDNCATVEEVIASDEKVRVGKGTPMPLHFLACDRRGNVATFEWLDGKLVVHAGRTLPVPVLTNDTYAHSLAYLRQHAGHGGSREIPHGSWGSLDRFVCATDRVKKYTPAQGDMVAYAFATLASVRQGDATQWMIVYNLETMEIHYQTVTCNQTRTIRVGDCDFDPSTPVKMIGINTPRTGLLNPHLYDYDPDVNRWLIHYGMASTGELATIPKMLLDMLALYPDAPAVTYLSHWEVAGPYTQEDTSYVQLFHIPLGPEQSDAEVQWKSVPTLLWNLHPAYVDLAQALDGGSQRAAYLRTRIESKESRTVQLEIYTDDGVKAWLNGKLVHGNNLGRVLPTTPDKVTVTLNEGTNDLMLKVTQNVGPWGATVRYQPVY